MPLQLTVTSPAMREYAQQGLRQQLNAGRSVYAYAGSSGGREEDANEQ